jgi:dephospho-CoA kinase
MLSVALTGNVASGKTSVLRRFAEWGAATTDADAIVHELERPGTPVFTAIVDRFGAGVVAPDGTLDRAALGRVVFTDAAARRDLELIVHPAVRADRPSSRSAPSGARGSGHDIPALPGPAIRAC